MKYLPKELKDAYEYDMLHVPIIDALAAPYINTDDVLKAHYILADYFTDESAEFLQKRCWQDSDRLTYYIPRFADKLFRLIIIRNILIHLIYALPCFLV